MKSAPTREPELERIMMAKASVSEIKELFREDPVVLCIMEGVKEGMKGPEIQEALSITKTEYETAIRRLRRTASRRWNRA